MLKILQNSLNLDLSYFLRGSFWLFLIHLVNSLKGLIISLVFANFLTKELYGQYSYLLTIVGVMAIFTLPGLNASLSQSIARNHFGEYFKVVKIIFLRSLFTTLLFILFFFYFSDDKILSYSFVILLFIFPFQALYSSFSILLTSSKKFKDLFIYTLLMSIFSLLAFFYSVFILESKILILSTLFICSGLISFYFVFFESRKFVINNNVSDDIVHFGKKVNFSFYFNFLFKHFDKLFVAFVFSFEFLAIYTVITTIPALVHSSYIALKPLLMPKLVIYKITWPNFSLISLITFLFFLISVVLVYFIFPVFYPLYQDYIYLVFLSLFLILSSPLVIYTEGLIALKDHDSLNKISVFYFLIFIILTIVLFKFYFLTGVILAKVLSKFARYILLLYYYYFK